MVLLLRMRNIRYYRLGSLPRIRLVSEDVPKVLIILIFGGLRHGTCHAGLLWTGGEVCRSAIGDKSVITMLVLTCLLLAKTKELLASLLTMTHLMLRRLVRKRSD